MKLLKRRTVTKTSAVAGKLFQNPNLNYPIGKSATVTSAKTCSVTESKPRIKAVTTRTDTSLLYVQCTA